MKRTKITIEGIRKAEKKRYNLINSILYGQSIEPIAPTMVTQDASIQTHDASTEPDSKHEEPNEDYEKVILVSPSKPRIHEDVRPPFHCVALAINLRKQEKSKEVSKSFFLDEKDSAKQSGESKEYRRLIKAHQSMVEFPKPNQASFSHLLKKDISQEIKTDKSSPVKPSKYPQVQLSKELLEFKKIAEAYQNIADLPKSKIEKSRSTTRSHHTRRRSSTDKQALGYQYRNFASKMNVEKRIAKCTKCNTIYCVCLDKVDDFCQNLAQEHQKKLLKCNEIKKEIGSIHQDVQRIHSKNPYSTHSNSFFVAEVGDSFETNRKSSVKTICGHRRLTTPSGNPEKSPSHSKSVRKLSNFQRRKSTSKSSASIFEPSFVISNISFSARKESSPDMAYHI